MQGAPEEACQFFLDIGNKLDLSHKARTRTKQEQQEAIAFLFVKNRYYKSLIKLLNLFALFDITVVDFAIPSSVARSGKEEQDYTAVTSWSSLRIPQDSSCARVAGTSVFCKLNPTGTGLEEFTQQHRRKCK